MSYRSIADNDEEYSLLPAESSVTRSTVFGNEHFFSLDTPWASLFEFIIVVTYFALLWIPFKEEDSSWLNGYNVRVTLYVLIYVFLVLSTRFVQWRHRQLRQKGYLSFYRKVRSMASIPMHTWSAGVACVALLFVYLPVGQEAFGFLGPINWLQILVGLQLLVILAGRGYYTYLVVRRNRQKSLPDARETLGLVNPTANVGAGTDQSDVVEKQADMIRYLQEQKRNLSRELVALNERVNELERDGATTFEGDAVHQLSVKDQEIRTLQAEVDRLSEAAAGDTTVTDTQVEALQKKTKEQSAEIIELRDSLARAEKMKQKLILLFELEREISAGLEGDLQQIRGGGLHGTHGDVERLSL